MEAPCLLTSIAVRLGNVSTGSTCGSALLPYLITSSRSTIDVIQSCVDAQSIITSTGRRSRSCPLERTLQTRGGQAEPPEGQAPTTIR